MVESGGARFHSLHYIHLVGQPDVVIVAAGGASCVPFLKAAKATGFNQRVPFIAHMAIELSTLKPLGMNAPEGVLGTSPYLFYYPSLPENKAFADKYKKVFDRYPTAGSFSGYISGLFIAKAYEKAGAADREKFIDALAGMTMDSPVGKITVREFESSGYAADVCGCDKSSRGYDFLIAGDIETIPANEVITPLEEVKKQRAQ